MSTGVLGKCLLCLACLESRYLRQRNLVQGGSVRARDVLHSLERNFGGLRPEERRSNDESRLLEASLLLVASCY